MHEKFGQFRKKQYLCAKITQTYKNNAIMKNDFRKTATGFEYDYPRAAMTADCVIFGFDGQELNVLLIKRGIEPYLGRWAFPGGFLRMDETIEACASRELKEETTLERAYMTQFGIYSDVERDPRGRVITTAFYALIPMTAVRGEDDAAEARWFPIQQVPTLAFDHDHILRDAINHLREDLHFRPIGFELLPEKFTIPQLQRLYEAILGVHFDRRNFMKKIVATGILEATPDKEEPQGHRPATYYSFNQERYNQFKSKNNFNIEF